VYTRTQDEVAPRVEDLGVGASTVALAAPQPLGGTGSGIWLVVATIRGFAGQSPEKRYVRITTASGPEVRSYTIIAAASQPFKWTVLAPTGSLSWQGGVPLTATVLMGPAPATDVTVRAALSERVSHEPFAPESLKICLEPKPDCKPVTRLDGGRPYTLFLFPASGGSVSPGEYSGTIEFASAQGNSRQEQLTLFVSSLCYQVLGVAAILAGVAGSLFLTLGIRGRLARLQFLVPAGRLRSTLGELAERLERIASPDIETRRTAEAIVNLQKRLSAKALDRDGQLPAWYQISGQTSGPSPGYQRLLDRAGASAICLQRIVDFGFSKLLAIGARAGGKPSPLVAEGAEKLDGLAPEISPTGELPAPPDASSLDADISAILTAAKGPADKALGLQSDNEAVTAPAREERRLEADIRTLSLASWTFVALLTVALGTYTLVLKDPSFGRPADLLICLLWGFGLPAVGGQGLQSLPATSPASVSVPLPGGPASSATSTIGD
jgi:hypothetical protein